MGRDTIIPPSASIAGRPANASAAAHGSTPRAIPLRVINPAAYASTKRRAKELARANTAASRGGGFGPALGSRSTFGPSAALFESLNSAGLSTTGEVTPPDTTGAIGPSDYVEFVNSQVAAFSRATLAIVGSAHDLSTFVGGVAVCDPQIKYDPQTSRWFYAAIRCNPTPTLNRLYVGFSKTSDPTDFSIAAGHGWCGYEYNTGKALEDYPKLGLDSQHIMIGTNSFNAETGVFLTAHIMSLPKPASGKIEACPTAPALKEFGSSGSPLRTSVPNIAFTPEPATVADASTGGFVVSADIGEEHVMIWKVGGSASEPKLEALGAPKVPLFEVAPSAPQPGTEDELDSLDVRFTQAVAAADPNAGGAEAVWTQHTVAGGAGSVVRWYEIVPGKVEVRQEGTISDPSKFVFNGAIAPTTSGGAVINYDTGSGAALVQIMAQSRIGSAPLGTMNTPITLASSSAADEDFSCPSETLEAASCRWGDYAGASVDPTNTNTVWGSNQINGPVAPGSSQWHTQNFAVEANDVAPTASFSISPNPAPAGSSVAFSGGGSSDPDGSIATYSWDFGDGSALGSGATPSHIYAAAGKYTVKLTVTDNGGQTGTLTHSATIDPIVGPVVITGAPSLVTATSGLVPALTPQPSSAFSAVAATNPTSGAITLTVSVGDPGTLKWLATFQNGKFGVFAASTSKCKKGFVRLNGRCRAAKIVFARGSKSVTAPGSVTFKLKPSASALKALKNALKHKKGLPVAVTLTFQSSLGGSPVSQTRLLTIKLKKK
jgi:PKD repeat protein